MILNFSLWSPLWNNENKSCLNELKFWEAPEIYKSSICWKFQLFISCGTQKSAKNSLLWPRWFGPLISWKNFVDPGFVKKCDELFTRPLSCDGVDTWGSYSLTLIDALDTLAIMGNYTEFQRLLKFPFKREKLANDKISNCTL